MPLTRQRTSLALAGIRSSLGNPGVARGEARDRPSFEMAPAAFPTL